MHHRQVFHREGQPPGFIEAHQNDHHDRCDHDQRQKDERKDQQRQFGSAQFDEHRAHGLAFDDVIASMGQQAALDEQGDGYNDEQHNGKRCCLPDADEAATRSVHQLHDHGRQCEDAL